MIDWDERSENGDEWEPSTGGPRRYLLSHEGLFPLTIKSVTPGKVEKSGNGKITIVYAVNDPEDKLNHGKTIVEDMPITGVVANGKNAGKPNADRLRSLFYAIGIAKDKLQALKGKEGVASIVKKLVGKGVHAFLGSDFYEEKGTFSSKPKYYVTAAEYKKAVEDNLHRDPLPPDAQRFYNRETTKTAGGGGTSETPTEEKPNGKTTKAAPKSETVDVSDWG